MQKAATKAADIHFTNRFTNHFINHFTNHSTWPMPLLNVSLHRTYQRASYPGVRIAARPRRTVKGFLVHPGCAFQSREVARFAASVFVTQHPRVGGSGIPSDFPGASWTSIAASKSLAASGSTETSDLETIASPYRVAVGYLLRATFSLSVHPGACDQQGKGTGDGHHRFRHARPCRCCRLPPDRQHLTAAGDSQRVLARCDSWMPLACLDLAYALSECEPAPGLKVELFTETQ
ncbi:hypothetical protein PENSTE_c006G09108 [Penicillium steckii]|uniref:Uncharacterized protein n=1 Tax=Penicillium steckii TaxID=303698 RepID=A0A1V6TJ17_9EURO|nr:hypothetical protein PENSTE_c006G09108 [Penicillium steckii]